MFLAWRRRTDTKIQQSGSGDFCAVICELRFILFFFQMFQSFLPLRRAGPVRPGKPLRPGPEQRAESIYALLFSLLTHEIGNIKEFSFSHPKPDVVYHIANKLSHVQSVFPSLLLAQAMFEHTTKKTITTANRKAKVSRIQVCWIQVCASTGQLSQPDHYCVCAPG